MEDRDTIFCYINVHCDKIRLLHQLRYYNKDAHRSFLFYASTVSVKCSLMTHVILSRWQKSYVMLSEAQQDQ